MPVHDIDPSGDITEKDVEELTNKGLAVTPNEDYVWDVFYHRPATISEWDAAASKVGML